MRLMLHRRVARRVDADPPGHRADREGRGPDTEGDAGDDDGGGHEDLRHTAVSISKSVPAEFVAKFTDLVRARGARVVSFGGWVTKPVCYTEGSSSDAGWSSPVARWAHNPKVAG